MNDHHFSNPTATPLSRDMSLVALAYELLDAHADTTSLVNADAGEAEWDHHVAYLRDLQRAGREVLAGADARG
jgi:hypothetical protein